MPKVRVRVFQVRAQMVMVNVRVFLWVNPSRGGRDSSSLGRRLVGDHELALVTI